jgi:NADH-quinone oxidoreductase subunit J
VSPIVFLLLAALTVAFALVVVVHRSPVYSALGLVGMMGLLSLFFVGLEAHMLAALQLIVYSGAIIVLVLFVIMLLNLEADRRVTNGPGAVAVGAVGGGLLAALAVVGASRFAGGPMPPLDPAFVDPVTLATRLFTTHLLPFELTSVLLLVAIVGAVVLGKRHE